MTDVTSVDGWRSFEKPRSDITRGGEVGLAGLQLADCNIAHPAGDDGKV